VRCSPCYSYALRGTRVRRYVDDLGVGSNVRGSSLKSSRVDLLGNRRGMQWFDHQLDRCPDSIIGRHLSEFGHTRQMYVKWKKR
jgi:hypothetical protein